MDKKFIIDANLLIFCHRKLYPFETTPAFWQELLEKGGKRIILLDKVKEEISKYEEPLSTWLEENKDIFHTTTAGKKEVADCYSEILTNLILSAEYRDTVNQDYANNSDSWVCAYGMAYKYTIVTNDKHQPNNKNVITIPNICHEYDIEYIGFEDFLRELGVER
jgi:hypothetical protein